MADTTQQQWNSRIGRRLKLRDIHILATVVEWGSMAKAASHLAMSQPAVSESVANLEAALQVRLLDRSARGVEPTFYAQALLKRGRVVFDELTQAMGELAFLANPAVGQVRVACGDTIASGLLPEVIGRLSATYPKLRVSVVQASADTLDFRELRERRVDLALVRISTTFSDDDLDVESLFDDRHRIVVGTSSPWARRRKLSLAELVDEAWMFPSGPVIRGLIAEAFKARGLDVPQDTVSASSILLRNQLLATGRFITVLPESVLRYHARQWSLKALPIDLGVALRPVAVVTLKNRTLGPAVQLFIEQVRAVAQKHAQQSASPAPSRPLGPASQ
jgi:DNA-binding transcriptional LysR family regulator